MSLLADLYRENAGPYPRDSRADEYSQTALNPGGNVHLSSAQGESKSQAEYSHYLTVRLKHSADVRFLCDRVKTSWPSLVSLTYTSQRLLLRFCFAAPTSSSSVIVFLFFFVLVSDSHNGRRALLYWPQWHRLLCAYATCAAHCMAMRGVQCFRDTRQQWHLEFMMLAWPPSIIKS